MSKTNIYIIRHGQTELNNAKVLQGRSDHPMNETGMAQAREAAQKLKEMGIRFDHVFTSPLTRAIQTAEIIAPCVMPVVEERLIEMDYGQYEGMDLTDPAPEVVTFFEDFVHNPAPEGMEALADVTSRVGSFLEDIRDLEGNILLSTHAIAMKGALEYLTPDANGRFWSTYLSNCAVYVAENKDGEIGIPREVI